MSERIVKTCPRCGQPLEIKTNHETGEEFLGCPAWKETGCKYTEPLSEAIRMRRAGQQELFTTELGEQTVTVNTDTEEES